MNMIASYVFLCFISSFLESLEELIGGKSTTLSHTMVTLSIFFVAIFNRFGFSLYWLNFDRFSSPNDFRQILHLLLNQRQTNYLMTHFAEWPDSCTHLLSTSLLNSLPPPNLRQLYQHFYIIPVDNIYFPYSCHT